MDNFSRARSSVDRAVDFGSTGREFESLRAHHGGSVVHFAAHAQGGRVARGDRVADHEAAGSAAMRRPAFGVSQRCGANSDFVCFRGSAKPKMNFGRDFRSMKETRTGGKISALVIPRGFLQAGCRRLSLRAGAREIEGEEHATAKRTNVGTAGAKPKIP
jgi:hypothetical protein